MVLRIVSIQRVMTRTSRDALHEGVLLHTLGTVGLTRCPRIQVCRPTDADLEPVAPLPSPYSSCDGRTRPRRERGLGQVRAPSACRRLQLIPVVTFLAPLASNFEGLKDR